MLGEGVKRRYCWVMFDDGFVKSVNLINRVTKVTFATVRTHAEYNRSYQDDRICAEESEHAECESGAASILKKEERVRFIVICHVGRILIFYCCVIFVIRFYCVVIDEMFIDYCWSLSSVKSWRKEL